MDFHSTRMPPTHTMLDLFGMARTCLVRTDSSRVLTGGSVEGPNAQAVRRQNLSLMMRWCARIQGGSMMSSIGSSTSS